MSGIKLRVMSTLLRHGQRVEIGSILTVPAGEAADYLDGPKVELLDPADRPAVLAARRAEVTAQLRQHGRQMPHPGSPWQSVNLSLGPMARAAAHSAIGVDFMRGAGAVDSSASVGRRGPKASPDAGRDEGGTPAFQPSTRAGCTAHFRD